MTGDVMEFITPAAKAAWRKHHRKIGNWWYHYVWMMPEAFVEAVPWAVRAGEATDLDTHCVAQMWLNWRASR